MDDFPLRAGQGICHVRCQDELSRSTYCTVRCEILSGEIPESGLVTDYVMQLRAHDNACALPCPVRDARARRACMILVVSGRR